MQHTTCNHVETAAANALCESFRRPVAPPAAAPRKAPTTDLAKMERAAIRAHRVYRTAKAANLAPIQSPREVRALGKYRAAHAELDAACRAAGQPTPRTWGL